MNLKQIFQWKIFHNIPKCFLYLSVQYLNIPEYNNIWAREPFRTDFNFPEVDNCQWKIIILPNQELLSHILNISKAIFLYLGQESKHM